VVAALCAGAAGCGLLEHRPSAEAAYSPQAERRFITIGTNDGSQFTDEQFRAIATGYDVVVLTKFHGGWDVDLHHEAARRLKELNPGLEVYAYMSSKYWFNGNDWGDAVIDPDWFLVDEHGDPIAVTSENQNLDSKVLGYYVDVTNPDYRSWLLGVARSWLRAAPYDGIRFDAADPIGDFGDADVKKWAELLPASRIEDYNAALRSMLEDFATELAPSRVLFNGISPSPIRGPDRGLALLDVTDGAMDESFCVDTAGEPKYLTDDIDIMQRYPDKSLQLRARANPDLDGDDLERLGRMCVGAFMMGWQPGATHFNMGWGYGVDQLDQQPPEIDLELGSPLGGFARDGDLLWRRFENGTVYVNLGDSSAGFRVAEPLVRVEGGEDLGTVDGDYTLDGRDAVFLLDPAVVRPSRG
jgi:Hypothetical glycosyl hydrolase family 15